MTDIYVYADNRRVNASEIPRDTEYLDASGSALVSVSDLPALRTLYAGGTPLVSVSDLPALKTLYARGTPLASISDLPALEYLDASGSALASVSDLPELRMLYARSTLLAAVSDLPVLRMLYARGSALASVSDLPALKTLYASGSQLTSVSDLPVLPVGVYASCTATQLLLGPIGSRDAWLIVRRNEAGITVRTGCFFGSLFEFAAAVEKTHGTSKHGDNYRQAIIAIKWWGEHKPTSD